MFRWCSYCSTFLGEKEPFENFQISHGICPTCKDKAFNDDYVEEHSLENSKKINTLMSELQRAYLNQNFDSVQDILIHSRELSVPITSLVMGLIVPSLYQVGELWSTNHLTVTQEHSYTKYCENILQNIFSILPEYAPYRNAKQPEVLLIGTEDNTHTLGIKIVELFLMMNHIPSRVIEPSIPFPEVTNLIRGLDPKIVGLSISMPFQMNYLRSLVTHLKKEDCFPKIALGGFFIRKLKLEDFSSNLNYPNLYKFNQIQDFIHFLKNRHALEE